MYLKIEERLKYIATHYRWAYEDLVYSEKMIDWNRCCAQTVESREEDLFDNFEKQAVDLMTTVQGMFSYLQVCYGSSGAVLMELRALTAMQKERRKTLCLHVKPVRTSRVSE